MLERGELNLSFDAEAGGLTLRYFDHRLPIDPSGYSLVLDPVEQALLADGLPADAHDQLQKLSDAFAALPAIDHATADQRALRHRQGVALKQQLARLAAAQPALAAAIDQRLQQINGDPADPASFAELDALLDAQSYRLAYWRVAGDAINYRRFFDINELAALRMENEEVFEATHKLMLELAVQGRIDGLRIDHPDGLLDPAGYFERLQARYRQLCSESGQPPLTDEPKPLYVVAEKIVAPHEQVPEQWAIYGTTGYRFANVVNGLFVDGAAKSRLDRAWRAFARDEAEEFEELSYRCRRIVMGTSLAGELTVLSTQLLRLARADRRTRDFTLNALRQALAEVIAHFPVYRTYVIDKPSRQDRRFIDWAIGRARRSSRAADATVFDFIRGVLLGQLPANAGAQRLADARRFTRRLQQYTAPVAAKGIEDTALYRHQRLVALNEVGGEPDAFGITVNGFHGASRDRALRWPHTMLATSTHDTKRSEDVRARLDVISELPAVWRLAVRRFARINRSKRRTVAGQLAPSRNDEYLLYQLLLGTLPIAPLDEAQLATYRERISGAMLKSVREAKVNSGWVQPDEGYEGALQAFIEQLLARASGNLFLDDLRAVLPPFARGGALNALSTTLLKLCSPGVPDTYQGEELIELSLVDPDNRRPVDYELRQTELTRFEQQGSGDALRSELASLRQTLEDGRLKLWTIWRVLAVRRMHPLVFADGDYQPLVVSGARCEHIVAFARNHGSEWLIAVATRLFATLDPRVENIPLAGAWADASIELPPELAQASFTDALTGARFDNTGGRLDLTLVLRDLPVAALLAAPASQD